MSAWDPITGSSVEEEYINALINAAQAVGDVPATDMTCDVIPDRCLVEEPPAAPATSIVIHHHKHDGRVDEFVSHDKHATASRIVSFCSSISPADTKSTIKINCGAMSAVVCRRAESNCFMTSWMDTVLASRYSTNPAVISTPPEQLSHWALSIVTMFETSVMRAVQVSELRAKWTARMASTPINSF